jgi:secondary thiamine-phosphate synthase enzyme
MIYAQTLSIKTRGNSDIINLTDQIAAAIRQSKIANGIAVVFVPHTTAAVTTSEYEPATLKDLKAFFDKLAPEDAHYFHNESYDDNGHSHIRASLLGASLSVPIENGALTLGEWQQIVLIDFDNTARTRTVRVQMVGE